MKQMGKILFVFVLVSFFVTSIDFSADALWRLMHEDQDALIIGKIIDENNQKYTFEVLQLISGKTKGNKIELKTRVDRKIDEEFLNTKPKKGNFYILSLEKNMYTYQIKWGAYKTDSGDFATLKLETKGLSDRAKSDFAAIQWYVNSGGTDKDFAFSQDGVYLKKENGESELIYKPQKVKQNQTYKASEINYIKIFQILMWLLVAK